MKWEFTRNKQTRRSDISRKSYADAKNSANFIRMTICNAIDKIRFELLGFDGHAGIISMPLIDLCASEAYSRINYMKKDAENCRHTFRMSQAFFFRHEVVLYGIVEQLSNTFIEANSFF